MALVPCVSCRRHVRAHEGACPFCGFQAPRASSLGALALAAGLVALTGCPDPTPATLYGAPPPRYESPAPAYGGPPPPAPVTTRTAPAPAPVPPPESPPAPAYGAPPVDRPQPK